MQTESGQAFSANSGGSGRVTRCPLELRRSMTRAALPSVRLEGSVPETCVTANVEHVRCQTHFTQRSFENS